MNLRNDGLDSKMLTSPMSGGRKTWTNASTCQCLFLPLGGTPGAIRKRPAKNLPIKQFQVACHFFGLNQASSSLWSKTYQWDQEKCKEKPEASQGFEDPTFIYPWSSSSLCNYLEPTFQLPIDQVTWPLVPNIYGTGRWGYTHMPFNFTYGCVKRSPKIQKECLFATII